MSNPADSNNTKKQGDRPEPERRMKTNQFADFQILETFRRFSQRDDVFSRSFWDPTVRSKKTERFYETYRKPLKHWRQVDGFTQKDYALRNAAWHVTDIFAELKEDEDRREGFLDEFTVQGEGPETRLEVGSPEEMSAEIKRVAAVFGADLVGITPYDERWLYTHKYSARTQVEKPNELPSGLDHVIVVAQEMDHDLIQTVPSALSGTATGLGYSKDVVVLLSITQYIRNLGYRAFASLNDTALAVPLAIQAASTARDLFAVADPIPIAIAIKRIGLQVVQYTIPVKIRVCH